MLRYIAFIKAPLKRAERAAERRAEILASGDARQIEFPDFLLSQYIAEGESEPAAEKLSDLLGRRYGWPGIAVQKLGAASDIRQAFRRFQQDLYNSD